MKWILVCHCIVAVAIAADVEVFSKVDTKSTPHFDGWLDGWTRIANINFSEHGADCPSPWVLNQEGTKPYCRMASTTSGCSSVTYQAIPYTKIRGLVTGYQKGTTDGFRASRDDNADIDDPYVDGVSITLGKPRRHVWTYAAGLTKNANHPDNNCPCSVTSGPNPSSFVGDNYYCSSGSPNFPANEHIYVDSPLWEGTGCIDARDNCCANAGLPWFYREFPTEQYDDIEVRICCNQDYSDEAVFVNGLELYLQ